MTSDLDIYQTANLVIKEHGENAEFEAGMRVDALLDAGDLEGRAAWMRVLKAIKELQNVAPEGPVH